MLHSLKHVFFYLATFQSGATIDLVRQTDRDWLVGRCHGNEGIFPASYVDIVRPLPSELVTIAEAPPQVKQLSRLFV